MKNWLIIVCLIFLFGCDNESNKKLETTDQETSGNKEITTNQNFRKCEMNISLVKTNNLHKIKMDLFSKTEKYLYLTVNDAEISKEYELFFFKTFKGMGHNLKTYYAMLKTSNLLKNEDLIANPVSCNKISNLQLMTFVETSLGYRQNKRRCPGTQDCKIDHYSDLIEYLSSPGFSVDCLVGMNDELTELGNQLENEKLIHEKDCVWLMNVLLSTRRFSRVEKFSAQQFKVEQELYSRLKQ